MISKNEKWLKVRESNFHMYFHVLSSVDTILQFNIDFDSVILGVTWEE